LYIGGLGWGLKKSGLDFPAGLRGLPKGYTFLADVVGLLSSGIEFGGALEPVETGARE
jgi:hypothetical protein